MKKKPTIAELENILDGKGGGGIYIAPNGELKNYPVRGSKKDAKRFQATSTKFKYLCFEDYKKLIPYQGEGVFMTRSEVFKLCKKIFKAARELKS